MKEAFHEEKLKLQSPFPSKHLLHVHSSDESNSIESDGSLGNSTESALGSSSSQSSGSTSTMDNLIINDPFDDIRNAIAQVQSL